jgi:hypothetical protein
MRRKLVMLAFPFLLVATFASTQTVGAYQQCFGNTSCPPDYSCADWGGYSPCGSLLCFPDSRSSTGFGWWQRIERYRVCFNQAAQSCTQYEQIRVRTGEECEGF